MKSYKFVVLASLLSVSIAMCSCSEIEENPSVNDSSYPKEVSVKQVTNLNENESLPEQKAWSEQNEQSSSSIEDIAIDNSIGYVSQTYDLSYLNLYYDRVSDHEIATCDGQLKGSFTYTVNENTVTFTTTYENLSDEIIRADFRPSVSFISDKTDNSNPIVTSDFDGHTIELGESYSFTDDIEIGEYTDVMINYEFKAILDSQTAVDSFKSEYGNGVDNINTIEYIPHGSVFPFVIHLSK